MDNMDDGSLDAACLHESPQQLLSRLESQDDEAQCSHAEIILNTLLLAARQPKSASGNACVKLCGYVDQVSRSHSPLLRSWTFSYSVLQRLFNFFVECDESDHHRSMKLVPDLITKLLLLNPDQEAATQSRLTILDSLVSILVGSSTKPLTKSALKSLDVFLGKGVYSLRSLQQSYRSHCPEASQCDELGVWAMLFISLFDWMRMTFILPTAGRLIVCLHQALRQSELGEQSFGFSLDVWHEWLLAALRGNLSLLEGIKNHVLLPIFKANKADGINFLQAINDQARFLNNSLNFEERDLLQLTALEVGKKLGFVEEPTLRKSQELTDSSKDPYVILREEMLEATMVHPSHDARLMTLSLLITSPSTSRPYSVKAIALLRKHISAFFAEPDARFRVELLGKIREMYKRVRGAIFTLARSIKRAKNKSIKDYLPEHTSPNVGDSLQPTFFRANLVDLPEPLLIHCHSYHIAFLQWYVSLLREELIPTASYQRHVAALKGLQGILKMESRSVNPWSSPDDREFFFDIFDVTWRRILFDLIMDPYEDIRNLAAEAVGLLIVDSRFRHFGSIHSPSASLVNSFGHVSDFQARAMNIARRTARADHANGAARSCQLFYRFALHGTERLELLTDLVEQLKRMISLAEADLGNAVLDAPLHGHIAAVSYTWQYASTTPFSEPDLTAVGLLEAEVVSCCSRIWHAVRQVLCDDSPEGHIPQELEDIDGLDTKDLLSFSFRAIHESSNLLRVLVLSAKNIGEKSFINPSFDAFQQISSLTFEQLSRLRHRGAFTTVSTTFATCCQQNRRYTQSQLGCSLLRTWYENTLQEIHTQASTTRRSAGIPYLITGILSANATEPSFEEVLEELTKIAAIEAHSSEIDEVKLPQVHAYNCLKDIFKNATLTALGKKSEQYLPQCLELAAQGLRSEVWAIRNCSLILLRSLVDCLFRSHDSKAVMEAGWDGRATRINYNRYPKFPEVLLGLLRAGQDVLSNRPEHQTAAESVFPALDIIRRAGPPDSLRNEIYSHVVVYLSSPVWHVREMAARTLCSCLLHENWLVELEALVDSTRFQQSQNYVHGVLLTTKLTLERRQEINSTSFYEDLQELIDLVKQHFTPLEYGKYPEVFGGYLALVNTIWMIQVEQAMPLAQLSIPHPTELTALPRLQYAINRTIAQGYGETSILELQGQLFSSMTTTHTSIIIPILETLPLLWKNRSSESSVLLGMSELYIKLCLVNRQADIQTVAINSLVEVLDELLKREITHEVEWKLLTDLWVSLSFNIPDPAIAVAATRLSGCVIAILMEQQQLSASSLRGWGLMMSKAGQYDMPFDTRLAAVEALHSYFRTKLADIVWDQGFVAPLSLYDALNDDDSEIRDVAAAAVSLILGQALAPIEAADRLLRLISDRFGATEVFKSVVVHRLLGHKSYPSLGISWEPDARTQLEDAMKFDDALFVIEKPNLYVDEVKETHRWLSVIPVINWDCDEDDILARLDEWLNDGLTAVHKLMDEEDGPLGWASDPNVYAICQRILNTSVKLIEMGKASQTLTQAVQVAREKQETSNNQIHGLLFATTN